MTSREIVEKFRAANADEGIYGEFRLFEAIVKDSQERLGTWDALDSISWKILHVVQAHSDCSQAARRALEEGYTPRELAGGLTTRELEEAFEERRKAIAALQEALERKEYKPAESTETDEIPF